MQAKKEELGLVLSGGGGKGAYQIGVWKYLREIGLDSCVSVVSGTSVGALNAVLFSLGDIQKAERIWKEQIENTILCRHKEESIAVPNGLFGIGDVIMGIIANGLFSRDGLRNIIEQEIDLNSIKKGRILIYATCTRMSDLKGVSFLLNKVSKKTIVQALLASSAIPCVFKPEEVLHDFYYDGGIIPQNNIPLEPLNKERCTQALVVSLGDNLDLHTCHNMVVLRPSKDLGDIFEGTLNFSREKVSALIQLGYEDAATVYAEPLHELSCKLGAEGTVVTAEDVIASFKDASVMPLLKSNANILPIILKDEKKGMISLSACLFDKESQKMQKLIKTWNVSTLDKDLAEMFGGKQMIVLQ